MSARHQIAALSTMRPIAKRCKRAFGSATQFSNSYAGSYAYVSSLNTAALFECAVSTVWSWCCLRRQSEVSYPGSLLNRTNLRLGTRGTFRS